MEKETKEKLITIAKYTAGVIGVTVLGIVISSLRKENKKLRRDIDVVTGENRNLEFLNKGLQKQVNSLAYHIGKIEGMKNNSSSSNK